MLYDILIIDDDFSDNFRSTEEELWSENDERTPYPNAFNLLLELIKSNLRVTYTTGELEDLNRLTEKDLSEIKYIFCDLHLVSIKPDDGYKNINSKILGILTNLNDKLKQINITIYINSKYIDKNYGEQGINDLQESLHRFSDKFSVQKIQDKNNLTESEKSSLINANLQHYQKNLIINKAIEVENIINNKLAICADIADALSFYDKKKIFNKKFLKIKSNDNNAKSINKQLMLLKEIRNKLAHKNSLKDLSKTSSLLNTFNKLLGIDNEKKVIGFDSFQQLHTYIESINQLINDIDTLQKT